MSAPQSPTRADACTPSAHLAQQLDALLTERDKQRTLWERHHAHLVPALLARLGAGVALERAHRAWACIEAADRAGDAALRLALDALRRCGVVIDVAAADAGEPDPACVEGNEL